VWKADGVTKQTKATQFQNYAYTVDVAQVFKTEASLVHGETITVITAGASNLCGVNIPENVEYLIETRGGRVGMEVLGGNYCVGLCGASTPYENVSKNQTKFLGFLPSFKE
jgi:hypothetical protein